MMELWLLVLQSLHHLANKRYACVCVSECMCARVCVCVLMKYTFCHTQSINTLTFAKIEKDVVCFLCTNSVG